MEIPKIDVSVLSKEVLQQSLAAGSWAHSAGSSVGGADPNIQQVSDITTPSMLRLGMGMPASGASAQDLANWTEKPAYGALPNLKGKGGGRGI